MDRSNGRCHDVSLQGPPETVPSIRSFCHPVTRRSAHPLAIRALHKASRSSPTPSILPSSRRGRIICTLVCTIQRPASLHSTEGVALLSSNRRPSCSTSSNPSPLVGAWRRPQTTTRGRPCQSASSTGTDDDTADELAQKESIDPALHHSLYEGPPDGTDEDPSDVSSDYWGSAHTKTKKLKLRTACHVRRSHQEDIARGRRQILPLIQNGELDPEKALQGASAKDLHRFWNWFLGKRDRGKRRGVQTQRHKGDKFARWRLEVFLKGNYRKVTGNQVSEESASARSRLHVHATPTSADKRADEQT
ncbi:hypothetical protein PAAG_02944 [Paracoccidioides lutzii Pb01]|uniref:Uncharacterized protein n=1 Tax=Paracoccidioides lutzii (strain ATCC MYA-826 / Pb01) TaxID=502779 RepID=C1GWP9_PARBA|nr:hypothetical protein PAAG_02944 [Paracoccidioides lutzii Pb01]EEH40968.2 hypothetical protein PAAG_02944 [Paracoccidioides lutzii Pb01]